MDKEAVALADQLYITFDHFRERFTTLFFSGQDLPKKPIDRHIVYISAVISLQSDRKYTERELNEELQKWTLLFGERYNLDHVTLRRYLIDERYLQRDAAGGSYELATADRAYTFDRSLVGLDLAALIDAAKQDREMKRLQHLKGSGG
jgi:hypothetical protein